MTRPETDLHEAARLWTIRAQDPSFGGWDDLALWLEEDARHLPAYEAALDADEWAAALLSSTPAPVGATLQVHKPRRWALPVGIAASVLAAVGGWMLFLAGAPSEIVTGAGEYRTVHLADGSVVTLNGSSRITYDEDTPRHVALVEGEALFDVRHDAADPFTVTVGETRLVDIGTVFNVVRDGASLDVAVAHGAVMFQPGPGEVRLDAGQALSREDGGKPVLRRISMQAVGGWQSGQLQYDNAPLNHVARDIGRTTGLAIRPGNGLEQMRFTGTVYVRGPARDVLARIGPLLGVTFAHEGEGWTMTADHGPSP